jgi:hypothetical protein
MHLYESLRARAEALRANTRLPFGAIPLTIGVAILLIVPIANAATSTAPTSSTGSSPAAAPVANLAEFKPQIDGRLSDKRSVSGDGIHARGVVSHAGTGNAVVRLTVRRAGSKRWAKVAATKVKPGKKFSLGWKGGKPGRYATRLTVTKYGKSADDHLGNAYVFRRSFASYYGPGLYGSGLACGGHLTASTIGVAHKTLPCGTKVTFNVGRQTVTARVIDRGPYVSGRDWDLTSALKRKLHFGSTGPVNATR